MKHGAPSLNFKEWEPAFLSDYIVNTHHKFVLKNLPELVFYTEKIASVHGENHPELVEIAQLFSEINSELLQHLKNEEEVLFPAIKQVAVQPSAEIKETIKFRNYQNAWRNMILQAEQWIKSMY